MSQQLIERKKKEAKKKERVHDDDGCLREGGE